MVTHAFSIDLEDWYHGIELPAASWTAQRDRISVGLDVVTALLDEAGVRATFFVLGWLAERHPGVVRRLAEAGHEIGSHGPRHERVYDVDPGRFAREEGDLKKRLEDLTGRAVAGYRAPFFSVTERSLWAMEALAGLGYRYDCSVSPAVTWRYGIAGAPEGIYRLPESGLVEFTVSTWRLAGRGMAAGGAYFRIFPMFMTSSPYLNGDRDGRAAMFYAHPWEFDPGHPVIRFERKAWLTHYFNLRAMARRTRKLLARHRFSTVREAIDRAEKKGPLPEVSLASLRAGAQR